MWSSDQVQVDIDEADGSETIVTVATPAGTVTIIGGISLVDGVLTVTRAHIQGLSPGSLTRAGLNAIGYKILEVSGASSLVIQGGSRKEALERRDDPRVEHRVISGSRVRLLLSMPGEIPLPVTAIQLIARFGTSLRQGHDALDRIARGETVPIELTVPDGRDGIAELAELGIRAQPIERPCVDVRNIRKRLDLTQAEFAIRFGLELDTVQNWEQGHQSPDATARTLLKVIEHNPEAVDAALSAPPIRPAAE